MIPRLFVTLLTDFNAIRDGLLTSSRRFVGITWYDLVPGAEVVLEDGEGNRCFGVIEDAGDKVFRVRPVWETWVPVLESEHPFTYSYVPAAWESPVPAQAGPSVTGAQPGAGAYLGAG